MSTQLAPLDIEVAVQALLAGLTFKTENVTIGSIGELDLDDDDQLIFDPPCVRTYYGGAQYEPDPQDSSMTTYNAEHMVQLWCAVKNLTGKQYQREDAKALVGQVLPIMAGARMTLSDGKTEPVRLVSIDGANDTDFGKVYVISVAVPGIAQYSGINF